MTEAENTRFQEYLQELKHGEDLLEKELNWKFNLQEPFFRLPFEEKFAFFDTLFSIPDPNGDKRVSKLEVSATFYGEIYNKICKCNGSQIKVQYDKDSPDALTCFAAYENGKLKGGEDNGWYLYQSNEPEKFCAMLRGKGSWGIQLAIWKEGLEDHTFWLSEGIAAFNYAEVYVPPKFRKELVRLTENEGNIQRGDTINQTAGIAEVWAKYLSS